jgi:hypothetical protein
MAGSDAWVMDMTIRMPIATAITPISAHSKCLMAESAPFIRAVRNKEVSP